MDVTKKKKNSVNTISRGKITNHVLNNSPYFNNVYKKLIYEYLYIYITNVNSQRKLLSHDSVSYIIRNL